MTPLAHENLVLADASTDRTCRRPVGRILAIGMGITVAVWLVVYVAAMPAIGLPAGAVAGLGLIVLLAGGLIAGRSAIASESAAILGARAGLAASGLNLLLLGSMGSGDDFSHVARSAMPWILGFTGASISLGVAGALVGRRFLSRMQPNWTYQFALVLALATLFLVKAGGAVTGLEAGMAVPDWLTTFGYPMMFYPLELMRQDEKVFVEHFHRLWGTLVGLGTILMMVHLWITDSRRWLRWFGAGLLLMVCAQGALGGTRVTEDNLGLAIVHGVFGQIVFAAVVAIAAFTSSGWTSKILAVRSQSTVGVWSTGLAGGLVIQLVLGAWYRHLGHEHVLYAHIVMALVVSILAVMAGGRAWGGAHGAPILTRLGLALLVILAAQICLGLASLIAVWSRGSQENIPVLEVIITTAHQVTGAIMLATATLLVLWVRRLVASDDDSARRLAPA